MRTWQWYALWAMFLLNTTAGLAILSDASSMAVDLGGATAALASAFVVLMAVADTTGRLFWPSLSDRIGRENVFVAMFLLQAAAFLALPLVPPGTGSFAAFAALSFVVLTCYGGGYATIGALVDAYYGSGDVGTIYGSMVAAAGWRASARPSSSRSPRTRRAPTPRPLRHLGPDASRRRHPARPQGPGPRRP
ncbi:hypothetical protein GBA65_18490 [Rubrobacter marinus]|uniref:Major facilitator superfamily (MFS) profile domain-containing protein n=1 Tax=Rubrobacter marinus TaxID=2653852 RepID=A0A6G8Q116_9ACTN|nr:hypothetical protein GBA65_18490 [Rubrobacter marinus]